MNRTQAERFISGYTKQLFAFALRRCACIQDAEDVAQETALRAFRALTTREDIADPMRYLWMTAHNVLANHYRVRSRVCMGIREAETELPAPDDALIHAEAAVRLRQEIAWLGRMQREILVAYYFHGHRQAEIAKALQIPLGTVKWHLFEAKKELKKKMEQPRNVTHLQFDPIRFASFGTEGSFGSEGSPWRLFRSALHQNIAYVTWRMPQTLSGIAEALGVPPVYVEDIIEHMTEQGYLTEFEGKYRCNLLLTEVNDTVTALSDRMYQEAAALIAPALAQALRSAELQKTDGFYPGCKSASRDFTLWALIPWCIASSNPDRAIPFADVAIPRPDGACSIIHANIAAPGASRPALYEQMNEQFSGPCWNECSGMSLWQLDTCWSERRIGESYQVEAQNTLNLLLRAMKDEPLSAVEYAGLAQKGLMRTQGDPDGLLTATLLPVWLRGKAIREKLLGIVKDVYTKHQDTLDALKRPYADTLLADTPSHLRRLRQYMLQNVYQSDWFIMHCLHTLVEAGLLTLPDESERASLHTILITE